MISLLHGKRDASRKPGLPMCVLTQKLKSSPRHISVDGVCVSSARWQVLVFSMFNKCWASACISWKKNELPPSSSSEIFVDVFQCCHGAMIAWMEQNIVENSCDAITFFSTFFAQMEKINIPVFCLLNCIHTCSTALFCCIGMTSL